MQTFLPYKSFEKSAQVLDSKRLGKQRVEAWQILNTLQKRKEGIAKGWANHPAVLMWDGYEDALREYYNAIVREWIKRGYKNNMIYFLLPSTILYPPWLGDRKFHNSHRSNLIRKDKEYYSQFWKISGNLPYIWPKGK